MKRKLKKYKQKIKQIMLLELRLNRLNLDSNTTDKIKLYENEIKELKLDLQEIDIALESLPANEMYLVKEHYISGREWLDIEYTYNQLFRDKPEVLAGALCKKATRALKSLEEFYTSIDELDSKAV